MSGLNEAGKNHNFLVIKHFERVSKNRFKNRSKFSYAVLEKWIFENFRGPFYDDVIHTDVRKYDQGKTF